MPKIERRKKLERKSNHHSHTKGGVDFAVTKDKHQVLPKYVAYLKGKDADTITNEFKEYTHDMVKRAARSVVKQGFGSNKTSL